MRKTNKIAHIIFAALIFAGSPALHAQIYSDSLIGTGNIIQGSKPSTDTNNATWSGNSYGPLTTANGLNNIINGNDLTESTYLPLTLDGSGIYTLSATGYMPSDSNEGIQLGFINSSQGTTGGLSASTAVVLTTINGGQTAGAGATSYYAQTSTGLTASAFDTANTFSITLNSLTGTVSFAENNTTYATIPDALTSTQMAAITGVGFGFGYTQSNASAFTNFSLTEIPASVPEPSTWALLFGSFALLVFLRRRKTVGCRVH